MQPNALPELLAPAGNWECVRAAVANGADAVYFGLPRFNARMRADNFREEELPELMDYLHARGVLGFLTLNVLVFTEELADVERELRWAEASGVDAVIVQDIGVTRIARAVSPSVALHASTQMTLTSPEGIEFARTLGVRRAVLARETSLRELEKFDPSRVPLEMFVHGALCVAYSGQCLTSESLGQRSANRGECAQACRMPYELVVDGETRDLGDRAYLLSPQDLAAVAEIPELIRLGVCSFKIEGRLKTPEYVAAVTQVYRRAIDATVNELAADDSGDRYQLEMAFSRGLSSGWMHGVNHQRLVHAEFGKKRGVLLGRVREVGRDFVVVDSEETVRPGDGVVFENAGDTDHEEGGRIYEIHGNRWNFGTGRLDSARIRPGQRIWKTSDPALEKRLRESFARDPEPIGKPVDFGVVCAEGRVLEVTVTDGTHAAEVRGTVAAGSAEKRPISEDAIRAAFAKLGGTPWTPRQCRVRIEGAPFLPVSELNHVRRAALDALAQISQTKTLKRPSLSDISSEPSFAQIEMKRLGAERATRSDPISPSRLHVLCRTLPQIEGALEAGASSLYLDFEDIRRFRDAVSMLRGRGAVSVILATPRIQKAGETGFFRVLESARADGVLVRNLGAIGFFRERSIPMIGDFSLNIANPLSAETMRSEGLDRVTISYDLSADSALGLVSACPLGWFEVVVHQHMPMFHMEHCVFAAFLSTGTDSTNCGRPCEKHAVALRDRVGVEHPLRADVGCRNTLFNAVPQTAALYMPRFREAGVTDFRLELLDEDAAGARTAVQAYADLLSGRRSGEDVWQAFQALSQFGVTRGTLRSV